MANALFDPGREGFLTAEIDWDTTATPEIRCYLVRGYTFNASHKWVVDITNNSGTLVANSGALTSKTNTGGVADAADVTFSAVGAGAACQSLIIAQYTLIGGGAATDSTRRLICYIDTGTGLPVTPNGGDITVTWDSGTNKIFKL